MPIYLDIAKTLEQEIHQSYQAGDFLPAESEMAKRFSVNRHTLRRAVDELISAGLVKRYQGKGNKVVRRPDQYFLHSGTYFTKNLIEQGSMPRSEVLKSRVIKASTHVARMLNLEEGSRVIHIRTFRKTEQSPRSLIDHYLPNLEWWPVLKHFTNGSLHQFILRTLNVTLERKQTRITALMANEEERRLLEISPNIPLLKVNAINVVKGTDIVAEFSNSHTRSDTIEMVMEH